MRILGLETSAKAVSAAVTEDGRVLAYGYQDTGLTHSRTLMPMVEHLLKNAGMTIQEMDAVAVAAGPGSFTGIRIGVAAAKGLCFAAEKPAIGVSTLAAMARGAAGREGLIVCAMDARRSQVYNAVFEDRGGVPVRLTPDRAISLEDLASELRGGPRPVTVVGDGSALCLDALLAAGVQCRPAPPLLAMQTAAGVALEAEAAGKPVSAQELQPFYLRPPQAVRLRDRRIPRPGDTE